MSDFSDVFGTNPGITLSANRDTATNTLNQDGQGLPVLFRQTSAPRARRITSPDTAGTRSPK